MRVFTHEDRDVGGDLIVARARGVQLAADTAGDFPNAPLDGHMDVLIAVLKRKRSAVQLIVDLTQGGMKGSPSSSEMIP